MKHIAYIQWPLLFVIFSRRRGKKTLWKPLHIVKKSIVVVQIDFLSCRVELERKNYWIKLCMLLIIQNLLSPFICQGAIQFLSQKQKMIIIKEKDKQETVVKKMISEDDVWKKNNFFKCVVIRFRKHNARKNFHWMEKKI